MTKMTATEIISSTAIVTIVTRRAIKKQIADEKEKDDKNNKKNKNIEKREKGNISTEIGAKIDINELHEKLGDLDEEVQN